MAELRDVTRAKSWLCGMLRLAEENLQKLSTDEHAEKFAAWRRYESRLKSIDVDIRLSGPSAPVAARLLKEFQLHSDRQPDWAEYCVNSGRAIESAAKYSDSKHMNSKSPAAAFIRDNFAPADRLAIMAIDRSGQKQILTKIATAESIQGDAFQRWLYLLNKEERRDISICLNPIAEGAYRRKKENIGAVRWIYLDVDNNGTETMRTIASRLDIPAPRAIIETSTDHFQVAWRVEGFTQFEAEQAMRGMAREFGADPAATDITRGIRLPGFGNNKYPEIPRVQIRQFDVPLARPDNFPKYENLHEYTYEQTVSRYSPVQAKVPRSAESNPTGDLSSHDWAWVHRSLTKDHKNPESVIRELAAQRGPGTEKPKPNPMDYATRTVGKAVAHLRAQGWDFSRASSARI